MGLSSTDDATQLGSAPTRLHRVHVPLPALEIRESPLAHTLCAIFVVGTRVEEVVALLAAHVVERRQRKKFSNSPLSLKEKEELASLNWKLHMAKKNLLKKEKDSLKGKQQYSYFPKKHTDPKPDKYIDRYYRRERVPVRRISPEERKRLRRISREVGY